jgi:hypothetical protein
MTITTAADIAEIAEYIAEPVKSKLTEDRFQSLVSQIQNVLQESEGKVLSYDTVEHLVLAVLKPLFVAKIGRVSTVRTRFQQELEELTAGDRE